MISKTRKSRARQNRTKKILFVCTGNVCRSVMAEKIFQNHLGGRRDLLILSAGTEAMPYYRIEGGLAPVMIELGVDVGRHRPRQLTPKVLKGADYVIVMEKRHLEFVSKIAPSVAPKVFLIKEFGGDGGNLNDPIHEVDPDYLALSQEIRN